jgi:hypothetical protein
VVPDRFAGERRDRLGNVVGVARRDDQSGVRPRVVCLGDRREFRPRDPERRLGVGVGVNRERGVAPRLVFDRRVQPHQQRPLGVHAVGDSRSEVGRTHPALAGVGVVDADDRHAGSYERAGLTRFGVGDPLAGE